LSTFEKTREKRTFRQPRRTCASLFPQVFPARARHDHLWRERPTIPQPRAQNNVASFLQRRGTKDERGESDGRRRTEDRRRRMEDGKARSPESGVPGPESEDGGWRMEDGKACSPESGVPSRKKEKRKQSKVQSRMSFLPVARSLLSSVFPIR
jgi:hypothetical protein